MGGESGETRCQGDMEKADMVDGKKTKALLLFICVECLTYCIVSVLSVTVWTQESKRVCAGRPLQR